MVKEIKGNLLEQNKGILCHQTNYEGVMGGGIALAIWNKLLTDQNRKNYTDFCRKHGKTALGYAQFLFLKEDLIVANCYSQNGFDESDADGNITNYGAMRKCFVNVLDFALEHKLPLIFIPYGMGCGIAGGNWDKVRSIIEDVFSESDVTATIVQLEV